MSDLTGNLIDGRYQLLRQMDAELRARDAGDPDVARRLRRLHWAGMLSNATLCIAIVGSFPSLLTPTATMTATETTRPCWRTFT